MNITLYNETSLELWITERFILNNILTPIDLDIENIARAFKIELQYAYCRSFSDNEGRLIVLDKRENKTSKHQIFFHELCHVLRHTGDQRNMPELFKDGQENEAAHFTLYAAMPFFMIKRLPLPDNQNEAVEYIVNSFQVTHRLAGQRLKQIQRRILQGELDNSVAKAILNQNHAPMQDLPVDGIRVSAYYDSASDISDPSQIVIEVSTKAMATESEFFFTVDDRFTAFEGEDLDSIPCTRLTLSDLYYRNDQIGINLSNLCLKYGQTGRRFVIQMRDIEQVLIFEKGYF